MTSTPRTLVFAGDSITDAGRREDPDRLGGGYVRDIARHPAAVEFEIVNAGISGDRVVDLRRRWFDDVLVHHPEVLTVLIGVNDMWRRYDSGDPTTTQQFEDGYHDILAQAVDRGVRSIILMEPFLLPLNDDQRAWRTEDLDQKIDATRTLAGRYGAVLIPLDGVLNGAASTRTPEDIAFDGVHPTELGHRLIAEQWWDAARPLLAASA